MPPLLPFPAELLSPLQLPVNIFHRAMTCQTRFRTFVATSQVLACLFLYLTMFPRCRLFGQRRTGVGARDWQTVPVSMCACQTVPVCMYACQTMPVCMCACVSVRPCFQRMGTCQAGITEMKFVVKVLLVVLALALHVRQCFPSAVVCQTASGPRVPRS